MWSFLRRRRERVIGLALGGGAARGIAHLGVIRAFREHGIRIGCISGTSIGAAIGALVVTGKVDEGREVFKKTDKATIISMIDPDLISRQGILHGRKIANLLSDWFGEFDIEDLPIPFAAVSVDLATGREHVMKTGPLDSAVRASISLPVVFSPWKRDGRLLIDGGVSNPVPVQVCRDLGADIVVAVNLLEFVPNRIQAKESNHQKHDIPGFLDRITSGIEELFRKRREPSLGLIDIAFSTALFSQKAITDARLKVEKPDYTVSPELCEYTGLEFDKASELESKGYLAALPICRKLAGIIKSSETAPSCSTGILS